MSEEKANELGLAPMAEIVDFAVAGLDPSVMGLGPSLRFANFLKKQEWQKKTLINMKSMKHSQAKCLVV